MPSNFNYHPPYKIIFKHLENISKFFEEKIINFAHIFSPPQKVVHFYITHSCANKKTSPKNFFQKS